MKPQQRGVEESIDILDLSSKIKVGIDRRDKISHRCFGQEIRSTNGGRYRTQQVLEKQHRGVATHVGRLRKRVPIPKQGNLQCLVAQTFEAKTSLTAVFSLTVTCQAFEGTS